MSVCAHLRLDDAFERLLAHALHEQVDETSTHVVALAVKSKKAHVIVKIPGVAQLEQMGQIGVLAVLRLDLLYHLIQVFRSQNDKI